jgi:hypothetical protein
MNRSWMLASALVLGLGAVAGGAALEPAAIAQDGPAWLGSFPAAQAAARESGKPIFLVFR